MSAAEDRQREHIARRARAVENGFINPIVDRTLGTRTALKDPGKPVDLLDLPDLER